MTKGSDLPVAALENEGVERIFGIPGEENLDVAESLRQSKIQLILTRHEQAGPSLRRMIRRKQAVDKFPDWALTFGNPDFVKYAESYGAARAHSRP